MGSRDFGRHGDGRRGKKKLNEILGNTLLTNDYLLKFFGKDPQGWNWNEWNEKTTEIQVALGVFSEMIQEGVRAGILLGLNDAFGKR